MLKSPSSAVSSSSSVSICNNDPSLDKVTLILEVPLTLVAVEKLLSAEIIRLIDVVLVLVLVLDPSLCD